MAHFLPKLLIGKDLFKGKHVAIGPVKRRGGAWAIDHFIFRVLPGKLWNKGKIFLQEIEMKEA